MVALMLKEAKQIYKLFLTSFIFDHNQYQFRETNQIFFGFCLFKGIFKLLVDNILAKAI